MGKEVFARERLFQGVIGPALSSLRAKKFVATNQSLLARLACDRQLVKSGFNWRGGEMTIGASFKIPKRYMRAFYFEESETGFASWIVCENGQINHLYRGKPSALGESLCLDWCAESIMQIRHDVGADL